MPELPEVQTVVDTLRPQLIGRRLACVRVNRADVIRPPGADLPAALSGRTVSGIGRRGKKILIQLDSGCVLCVHLGMTGRLTIDDPSTPIASHTHVVIDLTGGYEAPRRQKRQAQHVSWRCSRPGGSTFPPAAQLRFRDPRRFGGIRLLSCCDEAEGGLGPEPLSLKAGDFARRLARTRRAIKTALLDQKLLAGLGNIYADESLFSAGIHPLTPANRLTPSQVQRLTSRIKSILRRAIATRGSSFRDYVDADGNAGSFQRLHRVYAREGQPCRVCKTPIRRIVLGGRSTHFCPKCQARQS